MGEQLTPAQLVEAVRAERRRRWEHGDHVLAEEFLRRYPALQDAPAYALEVVYHEKLLRRELGEQPALAEYLQRFPQFSTQLRALFEVDSWFSAGPFGSSAPAGMAQSSAATPVDAQGQLPPLPGVPGYEILQRLGRGGMGIVYKARHERLDRLVALKMLLSAAHAGTAQVARFRAEAEAQARVQDPHIVQIFEVGEAQGCPYLALEYVDGGTLADRLTGAPQPVRWAAELVETLARAMHHAHQRGLVHRDLKPENILLTTHGIPKISDFGLAKRLEGEVGQTQSGAVLGTPSYMAPEQAWGQNEAIGPRADVYALGTILYEMLTGRPPFLGSTSLDTVLQVRSQEPVPVRRLQPRVPRDLETICVKCLEKEPDRRYANAAALADDVRRFLDGQPVRARPVGWWGRALKWAKRRPALVAAGSAALALVVAAWVVGTVLVVREKNRAEENLRVVLQAMDEIVLEGLESQLLREADSEPEHRETLQRALTFYEGFTRSNRNNPALKRELGRAYRRIGVIYNLLGQFDHAEAAFRQAVAFLEDLVAASPRQPAFRQELALCYRQLGERLGTSAPDKVEGYYRRAVSVQSPLTTDFPDVAEYRADLAGTEILLGAWLWDHRQAEEGQLMIHQGLRRMTQVVDQQPDPPEYRYSLAAGYVQLGVRLSADKDRAAAYHQALELFQALANAFPRRRYRDGLAVGYLDLGQALQNLGRRQEAEQAYRQAKDVAKQLTEDYPKVPIYRTYWANSLNNLGNALREAGQFREAEAAYRECLEHWRTVRRLAPRVASMEDSQCKQWIARANLANFLRLQGNPGAARPLLEEVVSEQRTAVEREPQNAVSREFFQMHSRFLAQTLEQVGDHLALAKAMSNLVRVLPGNWESYRDAARFLARCAALAEADTRLAEVPRRALVFVYDCHSRSWLREAVRRSADSPEAQNDLAWLLATTPDPRLRDAAQAVELARQAVDRAPQNGNYWNTLGVAYARAGRWAEARTALNESVKLRGADSDSHDWFFLAMACWHLGDEVQARHWWERAVRWMEENAPANEDLGRFRAEAAILMGFPNPPVGQKGKEPASSN